MSLRLRSDLHWCDCAGRAVFLDVRADRYFCLPQAVNNAFLILAAARGEAADDSRLRMLIERGLLVETTSPQPLEPAPTIERATRDFAGGLTPGRGPVALTRAFASEVCAAWLVRTCAFQQVIALARSRAARCGPASVNVDRSIQSIVGASDAISFVTRAHDRCLVRALGVHSLCAAAGVRPKLIFGVIAHPFSAHCWVQLGDAVLVGGFEQARLYTPILVIE
jgi:hypothetical protein